MEHENHLYFNRRYTKMTAVFRDNWLIVLDNLLLSLFLFFYVTSAITDGLKSPAAISGLDLQHFESEIHLGRQSY